MEYIAENWEQISLAFVTIIQAIKALVLIFKKKTIKQ